ncbi:MAG: VOC family protein [Polyangiales bacterium]
MANRKLFVNIAVKDLPKARAFYNALGFEFNAQFSNDDAASMVLGPDNYVMLVTEKYFATFLGKKQCDTSTSTEALICISADSRAEVDDLVNKALKAGGGKAKDPQDHGFMYGWSFYDLDGHHWEVMWMDPAAVQ